MRDGEPVPPSLSTATAWSWRLLVIGGAMLGVIWVIGQVWLILVPIGIAILIARILIAPTAWLRRHGWAPALATGLVLLGFVVVILAVLGLIGVAVARESSDIRTQVGDAVDDLEQWLVEDAPFDVSRQDVATFRSEAGEAIRNFATSPAGGLLGSATLAVQLVASVFVGLVAGFFALKDGARFCRWAIDQLPRSRRELAERVTSRMWRALGGFLAGAAALGVVEAIAIGGVMLAVGSDLAIAVAVLTFLAAFVPFVGAIVAGILAVLVTLATVGLLEAIIVAVAAILVQQFDEDLLAPLIYGHALSLHPALVLFAAVTGGALFGLGGAFAAVPVLAVTSSAISEARAYQKETRAGGDPPPETGAGDLRAP